MLKNSKLLRRCNDFVEAESIRTRLDAAGIFAVINGAEGAIALSYVGGAIGGVQLEVAPEDYDRAVQLLDEDELRAAALGPWICQACNEQNEATFEICWRCRKPRDEDDLQGRLQVNETQADGPPGPPTAAPVADAQEVDHNPYRPVLLERDTLLRRASAREVADLDDAVRRAYGGAIIGTVILPPLLNIYSIFLLLFSEARIAHGVRKYRIRLALTWVINIASIIGWSVVYSYMGFTFS